METLESTRMMQDLQSGGQSPTSKQTRPRPSPGPAASLNKAVLDGDLEQVRSLILSGADVNAKDKFGGTPLHHAANAGHKNVAELLIANGADLNAKRQEGWTPLHIAAAWGNIDVAELLIERGADVNIKDDSGRTPTWWAKAKGNVKIVELLSKRATEQPTFTPIPKRADIPKSNVRGLICNTNVVLEKAKISDDKFYIYTGDSWAFNPSLLFFFVVKKGVVPNSQSFSVEPDAGISTRTIHVHYRWKDTASGRVKSGVMMQGYKLQLKFGQEANGIIPGEISLEHTAQGINVKGTFNALIEGLRISEYSTGKTVYDPNAARIRAEIKKFPDVQKALLGLDKKGDKEVREWLRNPEDTSPSLAKAVHEVATAELSLIRKLAVEERARKTTAAIDGLLLGSQQHFNKVTDAIQEQRRRTRLMQLEARRSMTRRSPRGRGQSSRGVRQGYSRVRRTDPNNFGLPQQQFQDTTNMYAQPPGGGDEKVRPWLQTGIENRLSLAKAVHDQRNSELGSIQQLAVEEKAKKTKTAIDGILLSRQERHQKVLSRMQEVVRKTKLLEQQRQRFMGQQRNTSGRQRNGRRRPLNQGTRRQGEYMQQPDSRYQRR
jgi:hypothetical protein